MMTDDKKQLTVTVASRQDTDSQHESHKQAHFFPYMQEVQAKQIDLPLIRRFPLVGAIGLIGSALTCILSWIVLRSFDGRQQMDHALLKPGPWLSTLLAANGLFLRMALAEGVNVSWWYRASKEAATIGDLHVAWSHGTSTVEAAKSAIFTSKKFNYIALATLFVATIPLNGFLLQDALGSKVSYDTRQLTNVAVPMLSTLPAGFSAQLNSDGSVGRWSTDFRYLATKAVSLYESGDQRVELRTQYPNPCQGYCNVTARGLGFIETCSNYTIPYSLPNDNSTSKQSMSVPIFDIGLVWDAASPNTMNINTVSKDTPTCEGFLTVHNCTIQMATVDYDFHIYNVTNMEGWEAYALYPYGYYSSSADFEPSPNPTVIPTDPSEDRGDSNTTTFGGIAQALATAYNSSIIYTQDGNGHVSMKSDGSLALGWLLNNTHYSDASTPSHIAREDNPQQCQVKMSSDGYPSPIAYALDATRAMLFFTSILAFESLNQNEPSTPHLQYSNAVDERPTTIHIVDYRYWGGSVAVTLLIVLMILPTFWGYWDLSRRTTMSPAETARAFHAPMLRDTEAGHETKAVLKTVGTKRVNSDLS